MPDNHLLWSLDTLCWVVGAVDGRLGLSGKRFRGAPCDVAFEVLHVPEVKRLLLDNDK